MKREGERTETGEKKNKKWGGSLPAPNKEKERTGNYGGLGKKPPEGHPADRGGAGGAVHWERTTSFMRGGAGHHSLRQSVCLGEKGIKWG